MLAAVNPHAKPNSDVVRPWVNGLDITRGNRNMWIVDFPPGTTEADAARYELPFEYVKRHVKPMRATARSGDVTGVKWWLHQRPRPDMRAALAPLGRHLGTPRLTKYRLFVWLAPEVLADAQLIVFARDDDYFFGVLQSRIHEVWSLRQGTQLRESESGFRYTPTTCFETFPLPWPPGKEDTASPIYAAIAAAAKNLDDWRSARLRADPAMTLTKLYNERPTWLADAHRKLDEAVFRAYGWPESPETLPDETILERLLALNLQRAAASP